MLSFVPLAQVFPSADSKRSTLSDPLVIHRYQEVLLRRTTDGDSNNASLLRSWSREMAGALTTHLEPLRPTRINCT